MAVPSKVYVNCAWGVEATSAGTLTNPARVPPRVGFQLFT